MSAGAQFHEGIASTWTDGYQSGSFLKRLQLFRGLIHSSVNAGSSWLDLGCGSGVLTQDILMCGADRVVAVDGAPSMLAHAKRAIARGPAPDRTEFHLSDVSSLPFMASGSMDGVLCSSVIEYLADPGSCLGEVRRVLRSGGALIISVPLESSFVRRTQKLARIACRGIGKNLFPYLDVSRFEISRAGADSLLGPHGFRVRRQLSFDPHLPNSLLSLLSPALLVIIASAE